MSYEAHRDIKRLKHEYCFAIDEGRYDDWASMFTEDGRFVRSSGEVFEGHDELYEFGAEQFDEQFESVAHVVTNPVIDVNDSEATGRWYLTFLYETAGGESGWTQARYEDMYRNVEGEWLIAESNVFARLES